MTGDTEIRLPAELVEQCESRIEGTEFESVEAYVQFTIRAVVDTEDEAPEHSDDETGGEVTEDVEDRLASLGYK